MAKDVCHSCGQTIMEAHREHLGKMKLTMLKRAASHVMQTKKNDFMVRDIADESEFKVFNNFQKLRYHGLVTPGRDHFGNRVRGRWLITRNGWAFLRGKLELPKFVLVRNNHIVDHSSQTIDVREVYRGSDAIVTTFEYFDDAGNMIGFRPVRKPSLQASLL